jgi:O-methyltransferase
MRSNESFFNFSGMFNQLKQVSSLEGWIKVYLDVVTKGKKKLNIDRHNGNSIFEYPESDWQMIPFPKQKGCVFNADNLATVNRHEFIRDPRFVQARKVGEGRWEPALKKRDISWRLHTMLWAVDAAIKAFEGEDAIMVECGTGRGYMAAAIAEYYDFNETSLPFYLIDTFLPYLAEGDQQSSPASFAYADGEVEVVNYFKRHPNVRILKGKVPEVLTKLPDKKIAFLHMDLNSAQPEKGALEYLKDHLAKGSVVVFDDYGGPGGQSQAVVHERFAKDCNRELLILPTGQALLLI